jgi:hypothetical protein
MNARVGAAVAHLVRPHVREHGEPAGVRGGERVTHGRDVGGVVQPDAGVREVQLEAAEARVRAARDLRQRVRPQGVHAAERDEAGKVAGELRQRPIVLRAHVPVLVGPRQILGRGGPAEQVGAGEHRRPRHTVGVEHREHGARRARLVLHPPEDRARMLTVQVGVIVGRDGTSSPGRVTHGVSPARKASTPWRYDA